MKLKLKLLLIKELISALLEKLCKPNVSNNFV